MQPTNEVLDIHRERWERSTVARSEKVCPAPIDTETRSEVVGFTARLATILQMSPQELEHVIALLDILCYRVLGIDQISWLPGACVAACTIVRKVEHSRVRVDLRHLDRARAQFAAVLGKRYELQEDIVANAYHLQESQILHWLGWQIDVPTVGTWLSAFCGRLDMATGGCLNPSLVWIREKGGHLARFVLHQVTTLELQPEHFARGAFCCGLVAARLMPYDEFFPEEEIGLTVVEWVEIFGNRQCSQHAYPTCVLSPHAQERMCDLVEQASAVDLGTLRGDAALFVKLMRRARGPATEKRP